MLILARRPNTYTGSPLDRAAERRIDADWINARLADPASLFVPVWRSQSLLRTVDAGLSNDPNTAAFWQSQPKTGGAPEAVFLDGAAAASLRMQGGPWAFLGLMQGRAVFAVDLSAAEDPLPLLPSGLGAFADLRSVAGMLPEGDASVLAHARGLLHWRSRARFCGVCGGQCSPTQAGHAMTCDVCHGTQFPRTDPAVIMLVTHGDTVLLGHSVRFPNAAMYSTLAGFLEPGESLEEAVAREVKEESGVEVSNVQYHSSQPWPFPASIMLGFYARAETTAIRIDPTELKDARWFSREELRNPEAHGFRLPRPDSIARRLIEDWMATE